MSNDEINRHLIKASEETTRRNVTAAVDYGNETRVMARQSEERVEKMAAEIINLRQMFQQQMTAFASTTQRAIKTEGELTVALERIAKLEANNGPPD